MKLSNNGIEIRGRLHDKIHAKYGMQFISKLLTDRKKVDIINHTADEIDKLELKLLNIIGQDVI